jgi:hypothetical protein
MEPGGSRPDRIVDREADELIASRENPGMDGFSPDGEGRLLDGQLLRVEPENGRRRLQVEIDVDLAVELLRIRRHRQLQRVMGRPRPFREAQRGRRGRRGRRIGGREGREFRSGSEHGGEKDRSESHDSPGGVGIHFRSVRPVTIRRQSHPTQRLDPPGGGDPPHTANPPEKYAGGPRGGEGPGGDPGSGPKNARQY